MSKIKVFGLGLIIIGTGIIAVAIGTRLYARNIADKRVAVYNEYMEEAEKTEDSSSEQGGDENTAKAKISMPEGVIGLMQIDKIGLEVTIAEGTTNKDIMYSVGHFEKTALPGQEGNFAVVGHRSYTYGQYFNRLDEVENGDEIKVFYDGEEYVYVVDSIKVVEPSEVSVLEGTEGEKRITLVTCTPITTATHRLIVSGYLK